MINEDTIKELNQLVQEYRDKTIDSKLSHISYLLQLILYQSWDVKSELRIIENPNYVHKTDEMRNYRKKYGPDNAFTKYHLIIPLLLYLFVNHNNTRSALQTALSFMSVSKGFLKPGDFAKTKTGAQRFITNTRFASLELRNFGLLRSDKKHFYKYWSLSPFGIIVAARFYFNLKEEYDLHYFKSLIWEKASYISRQLLFNHINSLKSLTVVKKLFTSVLDEKIVNEYCNLASEKFLNFASNIEEVLIEGYNSNKDNTKELIGFINSINSDHELSQFADAIILKKDIDINMSQVYKILKLY